MVAATRSLLALLLCQVLLGGAAGLMPEVGRRRFSEPGRAASAAQRPEDLLSEFELRLLHMFGLKRRPSPGKDVVIPPYMLDLYRLHAGQQLGQPPALGYPLERAASRANTVRSFHHEGRGGGAGAGRARGRGGVGGGGRAGGRAGGGGPLTGAGSARAAAWGGRGPGGGSWRGKGRAGGGASGRIPPRARVRSAAGNAGCVESTGAAVCFQRRGCRLRGRCCGALALRTSPLRPPRGCGVTDFLR